jgi:hypothetical protein
MRFTLPAKHTFAMIAMPSKQKNKQINYKGGSNNKAHKPHLASVRRARSFRTMLAQYGHVAAAPAANTSGRDRDERTYTTHHCKDNQGDSTTINASNCQIKQNIFKK